ncbi:MAG: hypothetical protein M0Z85_03950 [Gammaproteobacteria bacterium]|jgi:hypothetical protein|nr:hypothetical protein [Gammaproteobacteria bacterium]
MKTLAKLCKPDDRQRFTGGSPKDYHAHLQTLVLADIVPEDVRKQFEVVRNLMLYGWFVYEFYTVGAGQALACLEFGLREAYVASVGGDGQHRKGLARYIEWAEKSGLLPDGVFHERINRLVSSVRNSLAHGGTTLLNYALAIPQLEVTADMLNAVYSALEERKANGEEGVG